MRSLLFSFTKAFVRGRKSVSDVVLARPAGLSKAVCRRYAVAQMKQQVALSTSSRRTMDGVLARKSVFLTRVRQEPAFDTAKRGVRKVEIFFRWMRHYVVRIVPGIAPRKMLFASIAAGVAFGMVTMAFTEHYFGPGVFARAPVSAHTDPVSDPQPADVAMTEDQAYVGADDVFFEYFSEAEKTQYEANIREMVKGYPIEEMLPYIFEQDHIVASFLIGIGKKESNWGKRVPVLNDQDCFNYWGYRGIRRMMGTGGHTCFNSRKDAVETVAKRLTTLIQSQNLNTPEKLVVWKCGFSCKGQSRESVLKWISDVDMYFKQSNNE